MDQSKTRMLTEAGVAIAIAQVLSFITLFHMPQGGSIKAAAFSATYDLCVPLGRYTRYFCRCCVWYFTLYFRF